MPNAANHNLYFSLKYFIFPIWRETCLYLSIVAHLAQGFQGEGESAARLLPAVGSPHLVPCHCRSKSLSSCCLSARGGSQPRDASSSPDSPWLSCPPG
jgi:hypothetical protein